MKELELRIKGGEFFDAYNGLFTDDSGEEFTYGIRIGEGFIDALKAPLPIKPPIECISRLRHGKVVLPGNTIFDSREVALSFRIVAESSYELERKKSKLYEMFYSQWIDIKIMEEPDIYHLRYTGKNTSYGRNLAGTSCLITAKFEEPDPSNRD